MEAFEPKWVNSILNITGVNTLRLGDHFHIHYYITWSDEVGLDNEKENLNILSLSFTFPYENRIL